MIERVWQSRWHPLAWLFWPVAWLFGLVTALRRLGYRRGWLRSQASDVPVIVVGNLTVGGVGKTPLVAWLADYLQDQGLRVGVVSRGYGRQSRGLVTVSDGQRAEAEALGDEPALLADGGLPVAVAERRSDAVAALAPSCDVLLADDGLQHYAMARAAEVLVVDGERLFGNRWLLPAGPLREPLRRARHCDLVAVRGGGALGLAAVRRLLPGAAVFQFDVHADRVESLSTDDVAPLHTWAGRRVHAVAGIGLPERFFNALRRAGLQVQAHPFPDHHIFRPDDLAFGDDCPVLMTSKDAVKCRHFGDRRLYQVSARVEPGPGFREALNAQVNRLRTLVSTP